MYSCMVEESETMGTNNMIFWDSLSYFKNMLDHCIVHHHHHHNNNNNNNNNNNYYYYYTGACQDLTKSLTFGGNLLAPCTRVWSKKKILGRFQESVVKLYCEKQANKLLPL